VSRAYHDVDYFEDHAMNKEPIAQSVRRACASDPQLVAEMYCGNAACAAREVTIRFKDYDQTLAGDVERRRGLLPCPVCGVPMKLHWILTAIDHAATEKSEARMSVNTQMYERDHRPAGVTVRFVPATVLVRDDLPPTPDGWWRSGDSA
jgi:hypothetical protein